ncbi:MAG: zinc ribbon domain-containing protein [Deltaproteobacteria bacterium]|nr:zinc ribbon domain-containing protein [Deltaproteobacteria bacterium]
MPVYEFYCRNCHTIFNFFSRVINTTKLPMCPRCAKVQLERRMSIFSFSRGKQDTQESDVPDLDEGRIDRAMQALARDAEGMSEDDPRQAASLMKKLYDATGLKLGPGMEEVIRRMEEGEDPEKIETEIGDLLESEDPFAEAGKKSPGKKKSFPARDDRLYDL